MNAKFHQSVFSTANTPARSLKLPAVAATILLAASLAVSSHATFTPSAPAVSLLSLVGGGSFTSGDKLFTNWNYQSLNTSVNNATITPGFNGFGFGFRITSADFAVTAGESRDAILEYTVTSTGSPITGVHMTFSGTVDGGQIVIIEQVRDQNGVVGQLALHNPPPLFSGTLPVDPQQEFLINKDIFLIGLDGTAAIDFIDQTFPQQNGGGPGGEPGAIPEPSSILLMSLGITILAWTCWHNRERLSR